MILRFVKRMFQSVNPFLLKGRRDSLLMMENKLKQLQETLQILEQIEANLKESRKDSEKLTQNEEVDHKI